MCVCHTSSIPDLQFDGLSLEFNGSDFEIDTNSGDIRFMISIIGESKQKTGFADTGITDEKQLEEIVVLRGHSAVHARRWGWGWRWRWRWKLYEGYGYKVVLEDE